MKRWWSCPWCCWITCTELTADGRYGRMPHWHIRRIHPEVIRIANEELASEQESE